MVSSVLLSSFFYWKAKQEALNDAKRIGKFVPSYENF
jgi:hypothetical protein